MNDLFWYNVDVASMQSIEYLMVFQSRWSNYVKCNIRNKKRVHYCEMWQTNKMNWTAQIVCIAVLVFAMPISLDNIQRLLLEECHFHNIRYNIYFQYPGNTLT